MLTDFVEKNLRFREWKGCFLDKNEGCFQKRYRLFVIKDTFIGHKAYLFRAKMIPFLTENLKVTNCFRRFEAVKNCTLAHQ